jgi:hypothetical protein
MHAAWVEAVLPWPLASLEHLQETNGVFGLQVGLLLESSGPTSEPTLSFGLNRGTMSSVTALF